MKNATIIEQLTHAVIVMMMQLLIPDDIDNVRLLRPHIEAYGANPGYSVMQ